MSILKSLKKEQVDRDVRFTLYDSYMLITSVLGGLFAVVNLINQRPLSNIAIGFLIMVLGLFWYVLSKVFNKPNLSRLSFFVFVTFCYVPLGYWISPGTQSAMVYILILVIVIISFVSVQKWEYIFALLIIIESIILFRTELWFPDHYPPYTDKVYRINDLTINFLVVAAAILITIYYVMLRYNEYNRRLYRLSVTDSLTGLYNRHYFTDFIEAEYNRSKRMNKPFSLVMIDLNHFKRINDMHGHLEGDQVLRDIADIIIHNIRSYDLAVRYGGDEFIIVLPETSFDVAKMNVKRMESAFNAYSGKYSATDFSVGFGIADSTDKTLQEILQLADDALYKDKSRKKELSAY